MEPEKNKIGLFDKLNKKQIIVLSVAVATIIAVIVGIIMIFAPSAEITNSVKTSLKEVFETAEMSTAEYTYNSIVNVPIDPKKPMEEGNIKYQVAYKGTVKSGFDFQNIEIIEKNGSIIVIVPKIEIQDVKIETDMEYIFTKNKYDSETTYSEAYNACSKDLESKAVENQTLYKTAVKSAVNIVKALTKPFEKQMEDGNTIEVVYVDEYTSEAE